MKRSDGGEARNNCKEPCATNLEWLKHGGTDLGVHLPNSDRFGASPGRGDAKEGTRYKADSPAFLPLDRTTFPGKKGANHLGTSTVSKVCKAVFTETLTLEINRRKNGSQVFSVQNAGGLLSKNRTK